MSQLCVLKEKNSQLNHRHFIIRQLTVQIFLLICMSMFYCCVAFCQHLLNEYCIVLEWKAAKCWGFYSTWSADEANGSDLYGGRWDHHLRRWFKRRSRMLQLWVNRLDRQCHLASLKAVGRQGVRLGRQLLVGTLATTQTCFISYRTKQVKNNKRYCLATIFDIRQAGRRIGTRGC